MKLGEQIRIRRKARKATLQRLSAMTGISVCQIGRVEQGLRSPSIDTLRKLCIALDINFLQLYSELYINTAETLDPDDMAAIRQNFHSKIDNATVNELLALKDLIPIPNF